MTDKDKVLKQSDKLVYKKALEIIGQSGSLSGSVLKGVTDEQRRLIKEKLKEFEKEDFK